MLSFMDRANEPADLDIPGWRLHPSKGNWRVIFRFVGSDIELVDYLDYH